MPDQKRSSGLIFLLPLAYLLFLPAFAAFFELGLWQQTGGNKATILREHPWRILPFFMLFLVVLAYQVNRAPLPRLGRINSIFLIGYLR